MPNEHEYEYMTIGETVAENAQFRVYATLNLSHDIMDNKERKAVTDSVVKLLSKKLDKKLEALERQDADDYLDLEG